MRGTQRISKTEIRERYSALILLCEYAGMPEQQRLRLAADLCPERSGSNSQKASQYVYAAMYVVRSYSPAKTEYAKELVQSIVGERSGAM